nr:hypothetical protein [Bacteroidota bacterium]
MIFLNLHNMAYSQFAQTTIPNQVITNPAFTQSVVNTGCDAKAYTCDPAMDEFRAYVWDGTSPTLLVQYANQNAVQFETAIALPITATDPDVCLVYNTAANSFPIHNGFPAAFVVFKNNGNVYLNIYSAAAQPGLFQCNSSPGFVLFSSTLLGAVTNNTAINIDSDRRNRFAIVWDDNGLLKSRAGRVNANGNVTYGTTVTIPLVGTPTTASMPDVAIFNPENNAGQAEALYCYKGTKNNEDYIVVQKEKLNAVINNNGITGSVEREEVFGQFIEATWPRITTSRPVLATDFPTIQYTKGAWFVCYELHDVQNDLNDIGAFSSIYDSEIIPNITEQLPVVYTNAQDFPGWSAINNSTATYQDNLRPACTFDQGLPCIHPPDLKHDCHSNITLAWTHLDANGKQKPIMLYVDPYDASIQLNPVTLDPNMNFNFNGAFSTYQNYLYNEVSLVNIFSGLESTISVAGEQTGRMAFLWGDNIANRMLYKIRLQGQGPRLGYATLEQSNLQNATTWQSFMETENTNIGSYVFYDNIGRQVSMEEIQGNKLYSFYFARHITNGNHIRLIKQ